jgi:hypothetical protein
VIILDRLYRPPRNKQLHVENLRLKSAMRFLPAMPANASFLDQEDNHLIPSPTNGYIVVLRIENWSMV